MPGAAPARLKVLKATVESCRVVAAVMAVPAAGTSSTVMAEVMSAPWRVTVAGPASPADVGLMAVTPKPGCSGSMVTGAWPEPSRPWTSMYHTPGLDPGRVMYEQQARLAI